MEVVDETAWSTLDPQNQEAHASPASARYLDRSAAQGEMSKRPDLERVRATTRGSNLGMSWTSRSWDYEINEMLSWYLTSRGGRVSAGAKLGLGLFWACSSIGNGSHRSEEGSLHRMSGQILTHRYHRYPDLKVGAGVNGRDEEPNGSEEEHCGPPKSAAGCFTGCKADHLWIQSQPPSGPFFCPY